ncbi:MAG: DUF1501 domain-containing protein [Proteobacteria bacterium]|nr:DUF1501 domain-containing protein [Verrucomicrobiota bacterium]NBU11504.1 DUF1501 domain-containing protein [Pseudomonadota bacterium]
MIAADWWRCSELGFCPVDRSMRMHDLNATLLHQHGLNHERLIWRQKGRNFRLTDVIEDFVPVLLS